MYDLHLIIGLLITTLTGCLCQFPCIEETTTKLRCEHKDLRQFTSVPAEFGTRDAQYTVVEIFNCTMSSLDILGDTTRFRGMKSLSLEKIRGFSQRPSGEKLMFTTFDLEYLKIDDVKNIASLDFLTDAYDEEKESDTQFARLQDLYVKRCKDLKSIPSSFFNKATNLKTLELDFNSLTELDLTQAGNQLETITARKNQLVNVRMKYFSALTTLNLGNNLLTTVNKNMIPRTMMDLDLSGNNIERFNIAIEDKPNLQSLKLSDNQLTDISQFSNFFDGLKYLDLRGNSALGTTITEDTFENLKGLQTLDLSSCGLSELHVQGLSSLTKLIINDNGQITGLPANTFEGTTNLRELFAVRCGLTSMLALTSSSIRLDNLELIDVTSNRLNKLDPIIVSDKTRQFYLKGNPLNDQSKCGWEKQVFQARTIVCVDSDNDSSKNTCKFYSFVNLLAAKNVLYNNPNCCDDASRKDGCCTSPNNACNVVYPAGRNDGTCIGKDVCSTTIPPGPQPTGQPTEEPENPGKSGVTRAAFEEMKHEEVAVIALGFALALVFFIILVIIIMRKNRAYEQWLQDKGNQDMNISGMHASIENGLDAVDGMPPSMPSTLKKKRMGRDRMESASIGSLSENSVYSQVRSQGACGVSPHPSPFSPRKKFKEDSKPKPIHIMDNNYSTSFDIPPMDSPTALSVYSYASFQQEPQRRRHRSGDAVPTWHQRSPASGKKRTRSEDLLDHGSPSHIPGDTTPSIMVRKASDQPIHFDGTRRKHVKGQGLTVKRIYRNPGAPTPPANRRALPQTPRRTESEESSPVSKRSHMSFELQQQQSNSSLKSVGKQNNVFRMDEGEDDDLLAAPGINVYE